MIWVYNIFAINLTFLDGTLYFIRGLHLQDFGFPRVKIQTNADLLSSNGKAVVVKPIVTHAKTSRNSAAT